MNIVIVRNGAYMKHVLKAEFPTNKWVDSLLFEAILIDSGFTDNTTSYISDIYFIFSEKTKLLLDAMSLLLAISNQYANLKINVHLDFIQSESLFGYLDRIGFIELLDSRVNVNSSKLKKEELRSVKYKGNNKSLLELRHIDISFFDENLPRDLLYFFNKNTNGKYGKKAYTFISEIYENVRDHSESKILGFIGIQEYYKETDKHHIQTVISDNGIGIMGGLKPAIISGKYTNLKQMSDIDIILEIFQNGRISRVDEDGRGLGLSRSNEILRNLNNSCICIRQKDFILKLTYRNGYVLKKDVKKNLFPLHGTHICIDIKVDSL